MYNRFGQEAKEGNPSQLEFSKENPWKTGEFSEGNRGRGRGLPFDPQHQHRIPMAIIGTGERGGQVHRAFTQHEDQVFVAAATWPETLWTIS